MVNKIIKNKFIPNQRKPSVKRSFGALLFKPRACNPRPWNIGFHTQPVPVSNKPIFHFSGSPFKGLYFDWIPNHVRILNSLVTSLPCFPPQMFSGLIFLNTNWPRFDNRTLAVIALRFGTYYSFFPSWSIGLVETQRINPARFNFVNVNSSW